MSGEELDKQASHQEKVPVRRTLSCTATWLTDTGVRLCRDGTAQPMVKRLDGKNWCQACWADLQGRLKTAAGSNRALLPVAMAVVGRGGGRKYEARFQKLKAAAAAKIRRAQESGGKA